MTEMIGMTETILMGFYFRFLSGVGLVTRKMGNAVSPVVDLAKEGDEYILSSNSTFKHIVLKFVPGVEFDQETPDGRKVKATITVDGNKLTEIQKGEKETTIVREFTDDEVKMVNIPQTSIPNDILKENLFSCAFPDNDRRQRHRHENLQAHGLSQSRHSLIFRAPKSLLDHIFFFVSFVRFFFGTVHTIFDVLI